MLACPDAGLLQCCSRQLAGLCFAQATIQPYDVVPPSQLRGLTAAVDASLAALAHWGSPPDGTSQHALSLLLCDAAMAAAVSRLDCDAPSVSTRLMLELVSAACTCITASSVPLEPANSSHGLRSLAGLGLRSRHQRLGINPINPGPTPRAGPAHILMPQVLRFLSSRDGARDELQRWPARKVMATVARVMRYYQQVLLAVPGAGTSFNEPAYACWEFLISVAPLDANCWAVQLAGPSSASAAFQVLHQQHKRSSCRHDEARHLAIFAFQLAAALHCLWWMLARRTLVAKLAAASDAPFWRPGMLYRRRRSMAGMSWQQHASTWLRRWAARSLRLIGRRGVRRRRWRCAISPWQLGR